MTTKTISKVPLLDLKAQYEGLDEEIFQAFQDVYESKQFILGAAVKKLEQQMIDYCNTQAAVAVSSGTDALLMALMALDIGPGDEVITTPFTFFATAGSIARVGATPVFCDIDPRTFNMDPASVAKKVSPLTKAIMPVHLFGQMVDMDSILAIAKEHQLFVIEDAAQSIGATYTSNDGKCYKAGSMGDFGCFSFFPSKNLGALGDAGLLTVNNPDYIEKAFSLRMHGETERYHHQFIGGNFRMDSLQAAFLSIKLPLLDNMHHVRQKNATFFDEALSVEGLSDLVLTPQIHPQSTSIYNQYTLRSSQRQQLKLALDTACIGNAIYYPKPLHMQHCFSYLGQLSGSAPSAELVSGEVLSIPVAQCSDAELYYIVETIKEWASTY